MKKHPPAPTDTQHKKPNIFEVVAPYRTLVFVLIGLTIAGNTLTLLLPRIIAKSIDAFGAGTFVLPVLIIRFSIAAILIFIFTYVQSIVQTYASERVARDLRTTLAGKISRQEYAYIQTREPSTILTNLTSDIDSIKLFVSQAITMIVSSLAIIIGASILLILIDWKLALVVLAVIPVIGLTFFFVLKKVRALFLSAREVIDWLNKVINESILGAALIRVVNAQAPEYRKFLAANERAKALGLSILSLFASLIPIITFVSGVATIAILALGGRFVIAGSMSLGDFTAFYSYLALLIFPILIIGFMSNVIAQASASYGRIKAVLDAPEPKTKGALAKKIKGNINLNAVNVAYGERSALKDVTLSLRAGTKTAIIGPTAAGKTQLLYLLTGLIHPTSGTVRYDDHEIAAYDPKSFHDQIGFVFQDSIIFNMTLRENIAFNDAVTDESLAKAVTTAELDEFIASLPDGLDTVVSERGTSLSGGQKQRIMLARALATYPRVLLLDDFTARVDAHTEKNILANIAANYPDLTLISVTQKISSIEHYDTIVLLMEGEILAQGTHEELLERSPEYMQIYNSQKSTNAYELRA